MTAKSNVVPALIHGVSQQDNDMRLPGHVDAMSNLFCDPAKGAQFRAPVEYVTQLDASTTDIPYCPPRSFATSDGKRWGFTFLEDDVHINEVGTTNLQTLTDSYLGTSGDTIDNIRTAQLEDTVLAVNKEKIPVADSSNLKEGAEGYADHLVTIDALLDGTTYTITTRVGLSTETSAYTSVVGDTGASVANALFDQISSTASATFTPPLLPGSVSGLTATITSFGVTTVVTGYYTNGAAETYATVAAGIAAAIQAEAPNSALVKSSSGTGADSTIVFYYYDTDNTSYADISTVITEGALSPGLGLTVTPSASTGKRVAFTTGNQVRILNRLRPTSTAEVGITVSDTLGNTAMSIMPTTVASVAIDTPTTVFDGAYIIEQASAVAANTLYFEFSASDGEVEPVSRIGSGTWIESAKIGESLSWDEDTMPHSITYDDGTGLWSIGPSPWTERETGDTTSVPFFDTDGKGLTNIFTFQNRLGFLYGSQWAFSKANDPYNFFRESAAQVADDDPLIGFSTSGNTGPLFAAEEANQNLVLFGTNRSLAISGSLALTPTTINPAGFGATALNTKVEPLLKDTFIYALSEGTHNNTYMLQSTGDDYKSTLVSAHVDSYMPDCTFFCIAEERNISVMGNSDELVVHQWIVGSEGFSQNAYHKWSLPTDWTLQSAYWDRDTLFVVITGPTGITYLTSLECSRGYQDNYSNRADLAVSPTTQVYDSGDNETTISYTTPVYGTPLVYITAKTGDAPIGHSAVVKSSTSTSCVVEGDWSGETVEVGSEYIPTFTLSKLFFRDSRGMPYDDGRLQLQHMFCHYSDSAYVRGTVSSPGKPDRSTNFDMNRLVYQESGLDTITMSSGKLKVPIRGANNQVTITMDSPGNLPVTFTWIEWLGRLKVRSRRS